MHRQIWMTKFVNAFSKTQMPKRKNPSPHVTRVVFRVILAIISIVSDYFRIWGQLAMITMVMLAIISIVPNPI